MPRRRQSRLAPAAGVFALMSQLARSRKDGSPLLAKHKSSMLARTSSVPPIHQRSTAFTLSAILASFAFRVAPVQAQTDEQRRSARELAAQGFHALQDKDFAKAEDFFRRADGVVHAPTLVLDHGRSLVGLGRLVEAHEDFAQVLREGVAANAPWQWRNAVDAAKTELAALEPRLAWLTVTVKGAPAPEVRIDSKLLRQAALGVPFATDPGSHTVTVRADRFLPIQQAITLREGQTAQLDLAVEPDPSAPPLPESSKPAPEVIVVKAPAAPKARDNTLATILLSAGGVGIATGAVTGFLALSARSDLKERCGGATCVPADDAEYSEMSGKRDRYRALGTASGVAFAAGVAAAVGGVALLVFSGNSKTATGRSEPPHDKPRFTLGAGLGSVSVAGEF